MAKYSTFTTLSSLSDALTTIDTGPCRTDALSAGLVIATRGSTLLATTILTAAEVFWMPPAVVTAENPDAANFLRARIICYY